MKLIIGNKNYSSWSLRPWLFGEFSIADCMFAPVVFRFRTYGIQSSDLCRQYMQHALASAKMQLWRRAAKPVKNKSVPFSERIHLGRERIKP